MQMTEEELKANLSDWRWRINNLYFITDKNGKKIKFKLNEAQMTFFEGMHYRNIILKARQLGFTTFTMIFMWTRVCSTTTRNVRLSRIVVMTPSGSSVKR